MTGSLLEELRKALDYAGLKMFNVTLSSNGFTRGLDVILTKTVGYNDLPKLNSVAHEIIRELHADIKASELCKGASSSLGKEEG